MSDKVPEARLHDMTELLTRTDTAGRAMHDLGRLAHDPLGNEAAARYLVSPVGAVRPQLTALLYRTVQVDGKPQGRTEREVVTFERPFEAIACEVVVPEPTLRFISRAVALEPDAPAPRWWNAETGEMEGDDDYNVSHSKWTLQVGAKSEEGLRGLLKVVGLDDTGDELWQWPPAPEVPAPTPGGIAGTGNGMH